MNSTDLICVILLIVVVLAIISYFIHTNPRIRSTGITSPINGAYFNRGNVNDTENKESKSKSNNINISFDTDFFNKKINSFLEERSEDLIEEWSLATSSDIFSLEERFDSVSKGLDEINSKFDKYADVTDKKIDDLDKRLKKIEDN